MKLRKLLVKTTAFIVAGMMCVMSPMSMIGDVLHTGVITAEAAEYTSTKLTKNKTYYFKVRAYRTINGSKAYSAYSSVKSVKVK